jgi:hypothetical protein
VEEAVVKTDYGMNGSSSVMIFEKITLRMIYLY